MALLRCCAAAYQGSWRCENAGWRRAAHHAATARLAAAGAVPLRGQFCHVPACDGGWRATLSGSRYYAACLLAQRFSNRREQRKAKEGGRGGDMPAGDEGGAAVALRCVPGGRGRLRWAGLFGGKRTRSIASLARGGSLTVLGGTSAPSTTPVYLALAGA